MDLQKNIFENLPDNFKEEFFEDILSTNDFKLGRIISEGHSSPDNFWYDQRKNEFILLLSGSAKVSFDNGKKFELKPGDYLIINAHQKHRVDGTDPLEKTFWLTLHY
ncbi:MAG: cupin domain-containing protein [Ignavibacteriales bacterium]|nr:cupin domain-containing protein [Ignavibacteriales bacterium]